MARTKILRALHASKPMSASMATAYSLFKLVADEGTSPFEDEDSEPHYRDRLARKSTCGVESWDATTLIVIKASHGPNCKFERKHLIVVGTMMKRLWSGT